MPRKLTAGTVGGTGPNTIIFDNNSIASAIPNANLVLNANGTGRITTGKSVSVTSNTTSTTSSTGALTVTGGVGVGENLFVGGSLNSTGLATANGNFFVPGNGTVAVGTNTSTPTFKLEVHHTGEWPIAARTSNSTITNRPTVLTIRSLGSKASPTTVTTGTNLGGISIGGFDGASWRVGFDGGAEIMALTTETWTGSARGTQLGFYTTSTGGTSAIERARFDGAGHFVPAANNTYDLGNASLRWRNIFTQDLHLSNGIGDYTVIEGEEDLFLVNNKNGKSYKFALIEVDPDIIPPKSNIG